jgi:hypothetical protein
VAAVIAFAFSGASVLAGMDWRNTETFYEMIRRVLISWSSLSS